MAFAGPGRQRHRPTPLRHRPSARAAAAHRGRPREPRPASLSAGRRERRRRSSRGRRAVRPAASAAAFLTKRITIPHPAQCKWRAGTLGGRTVVRHGGFDGHESRAPCDRARSARVRGAPRRSCADDQAPDVLGCPWSPEPKRRTPPGRLVRRAGDGSCDARGSPETGPASSPRAPAPGCNICQSSPAARKDAQSRQRALIGGHRGVSRERDSGLSGFPCSTGRKRTWHGQCFGGRRRGRSPRRRS